jgi:tellurite resistance protein
MPVPTTTDLIKPVRKGRDRRRLPDIGLTFFAIPLGICGLAGAWTAAHTELNATEWVDDILWVIGAGFWVLVAGLYAFERLRGPRTFSSDLRHPIIGPFAAQLPLIGTLLATHFGQYVPTVAPWIVWIFTASSLLVAAQLVGHWLAGDVGIDSLHPGYLLPVVAAAFVGSIGLSSVGATAGATAAFGIGIFFWLVIGTIVMGRLIFRAQLPDGLKPTIAILLAPPALAEVAWLFMNGDHADSVGLALCGVLIILLAIQLVLVPVYRKLPVSMSFWTFTFPIASTTNFAIRWFAVTPFPGSAAVSWVVLGLGTGLIVTIIAAILVVQIRHGRRARVQP